MLDRIKHFGTSAIVLGWLLCLTGCSTFNRDWQAAAAQPVRVLQEIDATPFRGHTVRLRAAIRAELPEGEKAALWLIASHPGGGKNTVDKVEQQIGRAHV